MKKVSLLTMFVAIMLFCGNAFAQSMYFDFEGQTAGNKIAQTLGEPWTTWSNAPGGAEDGVFGVADGSMAAHFTYGNDQVLRLGGIETGEFDLVFDAYVPNGKNGYFNVLHHFAGSNSTWAMQVYLCAENDGQNTTPGVGHGTVHAGSNGTADCPCVWDQWMQYRVHINMDTDLATLYFNVAGEPEQEMCSWQWSLDSFGANTVGRTLDAMDFFPPENAATSEFYIDNIGVVDGADDQVLIEDNFEDYTVGNQIAVEAQAAGNDWWTTWSNAPGGNEDGYVAEYGGSKCGHLTYSDDQVLLCGGIESGAYDLEFDILVPNGKNGYFNILHDFNGSGSTWAMQAYLHLTNDGQTSTAAPGHGTIHAGSNGTADIPAVYDEWMHFRLHVDTDLDLAEFYYSTETNPEEEMLCSWQWSLDSFGENVVGRKLDAMDFFPPQSAATSEYYLDNFKLTQIGQATAPSIEIEPEEISVVLEEDDATDVTINISNEEGTSIGDWTAYIDFGMGQGSGNAEIKYHSDIENSGIGSSDGYTREIGMRMPAAAYGGVSMGMKITSVKYFIGSSYGSADHNYTFRLYGQGLHGQPGEVLAEKTVTSTQLGTWITATFDETVYMTGQTIWATVQMEQTAGEYPLTMDDGTYPEESDGNWLSTNGGAFSHCYSEGSFAGAWLITVNCQGGLVPGTWAALSEQEGSLAIGESEEISVNINSIGYSEGDVMNANIIFSTNDPENDEVIIPLTLAVGHEAVAENAESAYNVYPNPTTGNVVVEGENIVAISIYNAAGQLINVVRATGNMTNVEMSAAGVYFLNVIDNAGNTTVQRVVVE